ncbi:MAG: aspartate kinase [Ruminococcaceae bacterium]|nr:aspartate kinase [Oscillospiraceae bacterium]
MEIYVSKFGGSSLADAEQFKKVKEIITADSRRIFIVPSAPGKRFKDDTKVTDMLYSAYDALSKGKDYDFSVIENRYRSIISELGLKVDLEQDFAHIKNCFIAKAGRDFAASRGEYLNGKLLSEYLGFEFVDAAEVVFFKADGSFDEETTYSVMGERLKNSKGAVIPGFYGAMPNDTIRTFSRGGSDITGSIVARAVNATLCENWTDVDGFLMADPRIIDDPKPIDVITYRELRELSYMGATVLHEDAIFPVRSAGIPINIRNTNHPSAKGTMIVPFPKADHIPGAITGIAGKKGFAEIIIEKGMMNQELGFGRRILWAFEKNGVSFEHLPSGIDTMSVIVDEKAFDAKKEKILADIDELTSPDNVFVQYGLALIAVVGRGMVKAKGTANKIFRAVFESGVNVKMIDQGSSELNIIIGVDSEDFEKAMRGIYKAVMN